MSKDTVQSWDTNPANNLDIAGTSIAIGCPPSNVGIYMRTQMAQVATWLASSAGPLLRSGGTMAGAIAMGGYAFSGASNASAIKDNGTGPTGSLSAAADRRIGYRGMPKKTVSTAYTVTPDDVGYILEVVAGGSIIFPRNSTLVGSAQFSAHDSTIVVQNTTTGTITLTQATSSTLVNVADSTTGNKTLKARGRAIADLGLNVADTWYIGGAI